MANKIINVEGTVPIQISPQTRKQLKQLKIKLETENYTQTINKLIEGYKPNGR